MNQRRNNDMEKYFELNNHKSITNKNLQHVATAILKGYL